MNDSTFYRYRDKAKNPKVRAKQKVVQNSLPVFDLTNFERTIFDNLIEFTIIKGSINPQLQYQNSKYLNPDNIPLVYLKMSLKSRPSSFYMLVSNVILMNP